jgi:hypothetical protein
VRRVYTLIFVLASQTVYGQGVFERNTTQAPISVRAIERDERQAGAAETSPLPESPGALLYSENSDDLDGQNSTSGPQYDVVSVAMTYRASERITTTPCRKLRWFQMYQTNLIDSLPGAPTPNNCVNILDPYVRFLDTRMAISMSPGQKGYLALRNLSDPFNLATIIGTSAFSIGIDSHTAYGPGWKGFGKNAGVSLLQDATGEFFGTFAIPSLTHEDPHYHRMPQASIPRRMLHAISRTVIAQHDDGSMMPNYSTLLTYPIASEISNLYVPGIHGNAPSTVKRVFIGYALDPVNNIVTEFLPDFAKHIHIRVIFVQQILNQIVAGPALSGQGGTQ